MEIEMLSNPRLGKTRLVTFPKEVTHRFSLGRFRFLYTIEKTHYYPLRMSYELIKWQKRIFVRIGDRTFMYTKYLAHARA